MVYSSPSEEMQRTPLEHCTPNTKVSVGKSKSRLRGRVNCRVLFPPEEPPQPVLPTVQHSKATPIKWSDAERQTLAKFVDGEHMAHKDMEFKNKAAIYIKNVSNTNHRRTGKISRCVLYIDSY